MLAYLLMVHSSPRQVSRLVNALQGPDVMFFIHVDRKVDTGQFRYMAREHKNVKFVWPRIPIEWGGWSMVEAELALMRWALRFGATHMTLLSGMDYPVWSNRRLREELVNSDKNYIEHFRIPSAYWDRGAVNRVRQYWLCEDPIRVRSRVWLRTGGRLWKPVWHRVIRRLCNLVLTLGFDLGIRRPLPDKFIPYVGSQWWSLSREAAQYVLEYVEKNPKMVQFYRHSHVPDEGFIQSVLMNSPLREKLQPTNLRYVDWDGNNNPCVLELNDLDLIVQSGCAFARKIVLGATRDSSGRTANSDPLVRALEQIRQAENRGEDVQAARSNGQLAAGVSPQVLTEVPPTRRAVVPHVPMRSARANAPSSDDQ